MVPKVFGPLKFDCIYYFCVVCFSASLRRIEQYAAANLVSRYLGKSCVVYHTVLLNNISFFSTFGIVNGMQILIVSISAYFHSYFEEI